MNFFKRRKWVHVHEFKTDLRFDYSNVQIYIHLYESDDGLRKVRIQSCHERMSSRYAKSAAERSEIYQERVVRWLGGRADIEIPRYSECAIDDTANALKGRAK
jgi:hypothetical protein